MEIVKVTPIPCESVEIRNGDYTQYYRYGSDTWEVMIGESCEPVNDYELLWKLETLYQDHKAGV